MNPKIYLDTNLLIDIFDDRDTELAVLVKRAVELNLADFPFTATQISEISSSNYDDRLEKRLNTLSAISQNLYLYSPPNSLEWKYEHPASVWETLNEVPDCGETLDLATFIPHEALVQLREELGLNPEKLNNMPGADAIREINEALLHLKNTKYPDSPSSIQEMMNLFENQAPDLMKGVYDAARLVDRTFGVTDRVLMAFSMLQTFGYWPDSKGVYNKGSGIPDGQHVINAVHYQVLASRDKGMRNRAAASYDILGVTTRITDITELKNLLRES